MQQKKGFTLIEISVCILILGLLTSLVMMAITSVDRTNRYIKEQERALVVSDEIFAHFKAFQKDSSDDFYEYLKNKEKFKSLNANNEIVLEGYNVLIVCNVNENNIYTLQIEIKDKDNKLLVNRDLSLLKVVVTP